MRKPADRRVLLVALLSVALPVTAETADGTLCVGGQSCVQAGRTVAQAAAVPQTFTYTDGDGKIVDFGVLPGGETRLPNVTAGITVSLSGAKKWPVPVAISIADDVHTWAIPRTAAEAKLPMTLHGHAGDYRLTVAAAGYQPATQTLLLSDKPGNRVIITLKPLPVLSGRVVSKRSGAPVGGATVSIDGVKVLAISQADGRFELDADPAAWPSTLRVNAAGFGERLVTVPKAHADANLFDVALAPGGTLHVVLKQPRDAETTIELYRRQDHGHDETSVASRKLQKQTTAVVFDDVDPGEYLVMARGEFPTQVISAWAIVAGGETRELTFDIREMQLELRATRNHEPIGESNVSLWNTEGQWRAKFKTGPAGETTVPLWQAGDVMAFLRSDVMPTPYKALTHLVDDEHIEWDIDIPSRSVRGRVVNDETGSAVPHANVVLDVSGENSGTIGINADEHGRFEFAAALSGLHALVAAADGYLPNTIRYRLEPNDPDREVEVRLKPATSKVVQVQDAEGRPLANAAVLDFADGVLTGSRLTDSGGSVRIPLPEGGQRQLFVIPRDGSFTIRVISSRMGEPVVVTVPPGAATIVVKAEQDDHTPIPGMWLLVRFNGVPLPVDVIQELGRTQGAIPVSGADGVTLFRNMPLGYYEFWPLGSAEEMRAFLNGITADPAVQLQARAGENRSTLTFAVTPRAATPIAR